MELSKRPTTKADYESRMLRVLVHIQNHLDEALCLEELAGVAHFSPYHFHRVFSGMVGETVQGHIRRLRLERAAHRLKFTDQPVTRIAFEAGYETHEAFTRAFRILFDAPPSEFRKIHQSVPNRPAPSGVHFSPVGTVVRFQVAPIGESLMEVRTETIQPRRIMFARHVGPYDQVGQTWARLFAWAGGRGLVGPATGMFAVVYDDPGVTPPDWLRYDACITVAPQTEGEGDIGVQTVGGGQ